VHLDFSLRVVPPPGREISFERIRELLYGLRDLGLPIRWITFDAFQSVDSRQLLGQKGFDVGLRSIDRDTTAYDFLKGCISDGRLEAPRDDHLVGELLGLELDRVKGKVDHRPGASKDVADALAGVVYGLTVLKAVWIQHGIPLREVPESIRSVLRPDRPHV
jgi:hypothetical protein